MTITDRTTGQKYQLVKRTSPRGHYLDSRTGQRYNLVRVWL